MVVDLETYRRVIAIGDVHGCSLTLRKLLFDELKIQTDDLLVFVGDYIDRGPDSKGVIDTILNLRMQGNTVFTLRGNHEQLMLDSWLSPQNEDLWLLNGGDDTLLSFGVGSYTALDDKYKTFFEETEFWSACGNALFVHAGLNFNVTDPLSDVQAMLWTRDTHVDMHWLNGRIVVHGHTPRPRDVILRQTGPNLNIDGGCVFRDREGMGYLIAFELKSHQFFAVQNAETEYLS